MEKTTEEITKDDHILANDLKLIMSYSSYSRTNEEEESLTRFSEAATTLIGARLVRLYAEDTRNAFNIAKNGTDIKAIRKGIDDVEAAEKKLGSFDNEAVTKAKEMVNIHRDAATNFVTRNSDKIPLALQEQTAAETTRQKENKVRSSKPPSI